MENINTQKSDEFFLFGVIHFEYMDEKAKNFERFYTFREVK